MRNALAVMRTHRGKYDKAEVLDDGEKEALAYYRALRFECPDEVASQAFRGLMRHGVETVSYPRSRENPSDRSWSWPVERRRELTAAVETGDIEPNHRCPECKHEWTGSCKPEERGDEDR
jgi:hypothetical protein